MFQILDVSKEIFKLPSKVTTLLWEEISVKIRMLHSSPGSNPISVIWAATFFLRVSVLEPGYGEASGMPRAQNLRRPLKILSALFS